MRFRQSRQCYKPINLEVEWRSRGDGAALAVKRYILADKHLCCCQDSFDSGAERGMTGIDEKGMVIPQKEGVYLSSQTAGSRDLFIYLFGYGATRHSTIYHFTYSRETHTLVPLTRRTAGHYPALMPANDPVRNVQQMNGNTGAYGNGYGDFELPEKWFRKVTHTPDGAANGRQPVRSETNATSGAAASRR
jgi:hypothetical protein